MKTLVTGGIRSGKSAYAEALLGNQSVHYLATGAAHPDDAAWRARVEAHRKRRPSAWSTSETLDIARELQQPEGNTQAVLVDDLGHWLSRTLDDLEAWDNPTETWLEAFTTRRDILLKSIETFDAADLVLVTGEVGFGLVSPYASGRLYTDELGTLNQLVAGLCDRAVLVVAGCPVTLKSPEGTS